MTDRTIDPDEVQHHLEVLKRILEAGDADARSRLLVEGFSKFGPRFLATLHFEPDDPGWREALIGLRDEASAVAAMWLNGTAHLGTADEDERRARFGSWMLDFGEIGLSRLIAKSILSLPDNHPLRDQVKARNALLRFVDASRGSNDCEGEILAIADLLRGELVDADAGLALIARGEELFPQVDAEDYGRDFLLEVFSFYWAQARDSTVASASWRDKAQAVFERVAAIGSTDEVRAKNMLIAALAANSAGDDARAVDAFRRAWSGGLLNPEATLSAIQVESRLRLGLPAQEQQVIDILAPRIEAYEERYIAAVEPSAIEDTGRAFGEVTANLAFAYAALGRWNEAVAAIEHGKSLRLRHQAALRRSAAGAKLHALEEQLHALGRGVEPTSPGDAVNRKEDWIGAELSAQSRVLEEYRRARAALPRNLVVDVSLESLAASLQEGEMALLFGLGFRGTLIAGVARDDRAKASLTLLDPDLTSHWLGHQLLGDEDDGFILALEAGEGLRDPRAPLERLLAAMDKALGEPLAALLDGRNVSRLVVVPHGFYGFIPFWALPSMARWRVVTVPSAAHFVAARTAQARGLRKATVAGDPTADLPISPAETQTVQERLTSAGIEIAAVAAEHATQHELARVAADCEVFHFCGHGRADLTHPLRAALLVRPAWDRTPLAGPEDFDRVIAAASAWHEIDAEHRATDVAGIGRLVEYDNPDSGEHEYFLEYSVNGTLWGRFRDGQRLQVAELWTAGDLMVQHAFDRCELAFLSACSTSSEGLGAVSEASGLPGALLLAGVSTIVATQWPVSDVLTALYVDLFYAELVAQRGRRDVAAIVKTVATSLREMRRDDAVSRLGTIQSRVDDPFVEFEIDAYKQKMSSGDDYPFAHPYAWASFHVLGRGDVLLPTGAGDG